MNHSRHDRFSSRDPFSRESLTLVHTRQVFDSSSSESNTGNCARFLLPLILSTSGAISNDEEKVDNV